MRKIFKYPFEVADIWVEQMPVGAEIIHVGMDMIQGRPCFWSIVDPDAPKESRRFRIYGTGHAMTTLFEQGGEKYLGTFQQGPFVWHVFEVVLQPV